MKLYNWLKELPFYFFVPLTLAILLVVNSILNLLQLNPGDNPIMNQMGLAWSIILGSIIVPVLETAIFQVIPLELIRLIPCRKRRVITIIAVIVSAGLFASSHPFSVNYVIFTFIFGLLFATAYLICRDKENCGYAFMTITLIHSIWNGFATIEEYCFS